MHEASPWQLRMFDKTLKKKQRLKVLEGLVGRLGPDHTCLLVTCGDNNGAMNYHLRRLGGKWYWADLEETSLREMTDLLGDEVRLARFDAIPFADQMFDCVISIDTHEHIEDPRKFTEELRRVAKRGGHILITVPGGERKRLVNRLKLRLGMTKERYGHVRDGYSVEDLNALMSSSSIEPIRAITFSRFFTELVELGINLLYVKILSKRAKGGVKEGTIAPQTREQLKSVEKTYRLYSIVYPFFWLLSQFDRVLFFRPGYVVVVEGRKEW